MQGVREMNLRDIEELRIREGISNAGRYAKEYLEAQGHVTWYSNFVYRRHDLEYVARVAADSTNVFRGEQGLPPLKWSDAAARVAREHAEAMASGKAPYSHEGIERRFAALPPHDNAGENLFLTDVVLTVRGPGRTAVEGWKKSPGHREHLLGRFNFVGIGVARFEGVYYFTQLLGRGPGG